MVRPPSRKLAGREQSKMVISKVNFCRALPHATKYLVSWTCAITVGSFLPPSHHSTVNSAFRLVICGSPNPRNVGKIKQMTFAIEFLTQFIDRCRSCGIIAFVFVRGGWIRRFKIRYSRGRRLLVWYFCLTNIHYKSGYAPL